MGAGGALWVLGGHYGCWGALWVLGGTHGCWGAPVSAGGHYGCWGDIVSDGRSLWVLWAPMGVGDALCVWGALWVLGGTCGG